MIAVVNKRSHRPTRNDQYVGRPSVLGNPFTHLQGKTLAQHVCATRDEAIERYDAHFDQQMRTNPQFKAEFERLVGLAATGDLNLVCWCAPLACHGHTLKRRIEEALR